METFVLTRGEEGEADGAVIARMLVVIPYSITRQSSPYHDTRGVETGYSLRPFMFLYLL